MILIIGFIVAGALAFFLTGLHAPFVSVPDPAWNRALFAVAAALINLFITGVLSFLVIFGMSFGTPRGDEVYNLYLLTALTALQPMLLWMTWFEALRAKKALWIKYGVFVFASVFLFFAFIQAFPPVVFLLVLLLLYGVQIAISRMENAPRRKSETMRETETPD